MEWHADPTVLLGLALICSLFWWQRAAAEPRHWRALTGAVLLTLLALESPLDYVADRDLFSAHMLQHLILLLGVAPLLALSVPTLAAQKLARAVPGGVTSRLLHPLMILLVYALTVLAWHAPALYNAALFSESVHALEHLMFVAAALPLWWLVLDPAGTGSLGSLLRVAYLILSGVPTVVLGIAFAFSSTPFYAYARATPLPGFNQALVAQIGLTPLADQQLGGLLMWVGGSFVYLGVLVSLLLRWLASADVEDAEDEQGAALLEQPTAKW